MSTIPSLLTKQLLHQQCILDGVYSLIAIALINTNNFTPASNKIPVNLILCYLFQSGSLTVMFRVMALCNIVCQSVDRLLALVFPNTYRVYTTYYVIICSTSIIVYSFLASVPRIAKANLIDGSCFEKILPINKYQLSGIESLLRYGIPISFLVLTNSLVIRKLYQLRIIVFFKSQRTASSQNDNVENPPDSLSSLQNALFFNGCYLTITQTLIECTSILLTILDAYDIVRYDVSSITRVYNVCIVVILDNLNPIVSMLTIRALRNMVAKHRRRISSICFKH